MIDHLRANGLGVDPVCQVLELSPSTYFAHKKRPKSARRLRDEQLMPVIEQVHAESGGTYGARRITRALRRKGVEVARCTVERLMAERGLEGVIRGRRRRTTIPESSAPAPGNPWQGRRFSSGWGARNVLGHTPVEPCLVAEFAGDTSIDDGVYRHRVRFLRVWDDLTEAPPFGGRR
ncbi:IS3 family transposase [Streptomyces sp. NPDC002701]|uniref:IS3 family transposase n=1 Tax=Streptomyces sp. NPDC002701 TaxID=3364661 RepID=UPI003686E8A2